MSHDIKIICNFRTIMPSARFDEIIFSLENAANIEVTNLYIFNKARYFFKNIDNKFINLDLREISQTFSKNINNLCDYINVHFAPIDGQPSPKYLAPNKNIDLYGNYEDMVPYNELHTELCNLTSKTKNSYNHLIENCTQFKENFNTKDEQDLFTIIHKLEGVNVPSNLSSITTFDQSYTLAELVNDITQQANQGKYANALDRVHTYCIKRFKFLLKKYNISFTEKETVYGLAGKYKNYLVRNKEFSEFTLKSLKHAVGLLKELNSIRNDETLSHDNTLINQHEAQYIFDTITNVLKFIEVSESK